LAACVRHSKINIDQSPGDTGVVEKNTTGRCGKWYLSGLQKAFNTGPQKRLLDKDRAFGNYWQIPYVNSFYQVMHFNAKRSLAIACCLSVCNVGGLW